MNIDRKNGLDKVDLTDGQLRDIVAFRTPAPADRPQELCDAFKLVACPKCGSRRGEMFVFVAHSGPHPAC